jgi:hypothetical protein
MKIAEWAARVLGDGFDSFVWHGFAQGGTHRMQECRCFCSAPN